MLGSHTANSKGELFFFILKNSLSWILELEKRAERKLMLLVYPHVPGILHISFKTPNKSFKEESTPNSLNSDRLVSDQESPILEVVDLGLNIGLADFQVHVHSTPIQSPALCCQCSNFIKEILLKN